MSASRPPQWPLLRCSIALHLHNINAMTARSFSVVELHRGQGKEGKMAARILPLSSSQSCCPQSIAPSSKPLALKSSRVAARVSKTRAMAENQDADEGGEQKGGNQSFFSRITEALDFSQVRSYEDAVLIEEAKEATQSGGKMSREQYGALRRKIGGTYKDFFKSYVDVEGQYVEDGWVDKTCKVCKRDTRGEPRQVDKLGRYVHVSCLENSKSGNFFSNLFSK